MQPTGLSVTHHNAVGPLAPGRYFVSLAQGQAALVEVMAHAVRAGHCSWHRSLCCRTAWRLHHGQNQPPGEQRAAQHQVPRTECNQCTHTAAEVVKDGPCCFRICCMHACVLTSNPYTPTSTYKYPPYPNCTLHAYGMHMQSTLRWITNYTIEQASSTPRCGLHGGYSEPLACTKHHHALGSRCGMRTDRQCCWEARRTQYGLNMAAGSATRTAGQHADHVMARTQPPGKQRAAQHQVPRTECN